MNELIKITEHNGQRAVNARELHAFLESKQQFADWIKDRIEKFGFVENQDFEVFQNFMKNPQGGRPSKEYALSIDMAKELSMVENNERGRQARKYFIECEKAYRAAKTPQTYLEALKALVASEEERQKLALENKQQAEKIEEDRPKVEFFDDVADSKTAVELGIAAKTLNFANIGRNNLFEFLRNNKILMEKHNVPYQKYIDCGYFRIIEQRYDRADGVSCINFKTLVYQRGIDFIRKLLLKQGYKPNNK